MLKYLNLLIGGAIGTVCRYSLSGFIYKIWGSAFPYGTLVVNLLGCLIAGFLLAITEKKLLLGPNIRLLLMIGFCGAFTTFSTFILETASLMRDEQVMRTFINLLISVTLGFFALRAGIILGEAI